MDERGKQRIPNAMGKIVMININIRQNDNALMFNLDTYELACY